MFIKMKLVFQAKPRGEGLKGGQSGIGHHRSGGGGKLLSSEETLAVKRRFPPGHIGSRRESGVITLEFALLVPFFILLVIGLLEFGHIWYVKHQLTIASREGARLASSHAWPKPAGWKPDKVAVQKLVQDYLGAGFVNGYHVEVLPEGDGFSSGATGADVRVRLTADQNLTLLLHYLVPGLNGLVLEAQTTMRIE